MTDAFIVAREIFIAASPETVFRFFVDPAPMARWIGQQHTLDPRPGGIFRIAVAADAIARGNYTEVTPCRRIAFTWGWEGRDDLPPGGSLVEIELEARDGGTLVRLRHSGLPYGARPPFMPGEHGKRWMHYLGRLAQQFATPVTSRTEDAVNVIQERDTTTIRQTVTFSAPPLEVYEMIMDSGKHASLSGETAVISREVGGAFTAWGDHISGFNLALRPWGHRSRPISPRPLARPNFTQ